MNKLKKFVNDNSINNIRTGKVLTKNDTEVTVQVGSVIITYYTSLDIKVGDSVLIQCPDGVDNKGYITGKAQASTSEGINVVV